ncbi:hypothetical protein SAMN06264364_12934 [Quadrisphaera granulorum]|uniref:Two-component sensor histidine kinase n=1 Tax=Quadrisphaera granulorum TaxID=317664 RepID=A0A315ZTZ8_9ACTN|nr:hypothetical protein [Quadrisphaera granulorum]PWJ48653.1 hypothetical protein BXY45_12934 [Quadrisphaera granulorum]SZE98375.1 hypothetical protein SAMN06264364_12934 [Quadrisphaera granulorum]
MILLAVALLLLVVVGVLGVVALGAWEARTFAAAPARPALLAVLDEARAAQPEGVEAPRPVRALRSVLTAA